ncbi:MAG: prepilin-type N-terminal cleavage/methylation domain-containing protein [bacterium]|nr:prepilin-type N-terminal cleavage/methylation domain-containing protein [bacterium]
MKHLNAKQQGFTLIEVVIVTFLFSILLLGLMSLYDWHQKVYMLEQAEVQATGSVRSAMNNMSRYIAQGREIDSSRTINGTTYNTSSSSIIVEIPSLSASGDVVNGGFDYVVYYLSGTNLYQVIETGSGSVRIGGTKQLSSAMESLTFTYNNADPTIASQVIIDMQARATARGTSSVTAHVIDTIFLRNR